MNYLQNYSQRLVVFVLYAITSVLTELTSAASPDTTPDAHARGLTFMRKLWGDFLAGSPQVLLAALLEQSLDDADARWRYARVLGSSRSAGVCGQTRGARSGHVPYYQCPACAAELSFTLAVSLAAAIYNLGPLSP